MSTPDLLDFDVPKVGVVVAAPLSHPMAGVNPSPMFPGDLVEVIGYSDAGNYKTFCTEDQSLPWFVNPKDIELIGDL